MQAFTFPSFTRFRRLGLGLVALALSASGAMAQMPKIFVALEGSDNNAGTSVSPKRTFQAAHDAVNAGGEIVVLDTAGYGALTITKSLTITVPTGANGFVTVNGGANGITIAATSSDNIAIRGLTIESDSTSSSSRGIDIEAAGQVQIEGCTVRSFGTAILLNASSTDLSVLVSGSVLRDCNSGFINQANGPSGSPYNSAAVLNDVTVNNSGNGFFTTVVNGQAFTTLVRCTAHACVFGINSGSGVTYADNCTISGSLFYGVYTQGGGPVYTRNNNLFTDNVNNGSFNGGTIAPL